MTTPCTSLEVYRVLTVRQPWADLIMSGVKDVENRTWPVPSTLPQWYVTDEGERYLPDPAERDEHSSSCDLCRPVGPFPFRLWIHASKQPAAVHESVLDNWLEFCWREGAYEQYHLGVLLGTVEVTGCHHADDCYLPDGMHDTLVGPQYHAEEWCSRWAEPDCWHWQLTDPQPLDEPIPAKGRLGLWTLPDDIALPA